MYIPRRFAATGRKFRFNLPRLLLLWQSRKFDLTSGAKLSRKSSGFRAFFSNIWIRYLRNTPNWDWIADLGLFSPLSHVDFRRIWTMIVDRNEYESSALNFNRFSFNRVIPIFPSFNLHKGMDRISPIRALNHREKLWSVTRGLTRGSLRG